MQFVNALQNPMCLYLSKISKAQRSRKMNFSKQAQQFWNKYEERKSQEALKNQMNIKIQNLLLGRPEVTIE
ncbi:unnamed protein product [Brachionus calyciflorus]|uniref:Uncharacterized protein n=1 Tax=Brachionus calyciflorus TaxID=104777 RepID=A0A814A486_9BILA|nr:unnamed protein product [Brachionus calyciflorus]